MPDGQALEVVHGADGGRIELDEDLDRLPSSPDWIVVASWATSADRTWPATCAALSPTEIGLVGIDRDLDLRASP